ncbi:MAG: hypothetical protein GC158_16855 [Cyanobacteria bacterium RI_101]|nr:hypothetical protein [Cyanobacteria bacterium RI_101]
MFYIEQEITRRFADLKVFSTIERKKKSSYYDFFVKSQGKVEKAIQKFAPIANHYTSYNPDDTYNVFITTDNYGIGVNMQDASVVINYDLSWTPIEPIQRAGRVLRPWDTFREVKLFTFIPKLAQVEDIQKEAVNITKRWDRLIDRHRESRKVTLVPVLTQEDSQRINMPEIAPDIDVTTGILDFENLDDSEVSIFYQHMKKLHEVREEAETLNSDLVSALNYQGSSILLYLLLFFQDEYKLVVYSPREERCLNYPPERLLNLIECEPEEPIAFVDADEIEALADKAIACWCQTHQVEPAEVLRECALYLQPGGQEKTVKELLQKELLQ